MPIDLTKVDEINLVKVSAVLIIFEVISIGISVLIYNQFKEIAYAVYIFGFIAPIFLCASISFLMFKYRLFVKLYNEVFAFVSVVVILTGLFIIQYFLKASPGSVVLILLLVLFLISYGVFSWFTNKIILFLANVYIKMTNPITNTLVENTIIFRVDERNKENKINSLFILLKEVFAFRQIKRILNRYLLINNSGTYIHIYRYQNTLLITPFKNSIYEFDFNVSDIRQSISDLAISLLNFEKIEEKKDEESSDAVKTYIKDFTEFSVKKSEIKDIFPIARTIAIVIVIVVAIILLFIFYPSIPGIFQYLQDTGTTPIIIGTIIGSILTAVLLYFGKFFQKKFLKK